MIELIKSSHPVLSAGMEDQLSGRPMEVCLGFHFENAGYKFGTFSVILHIPEYSSIHFIS